jgi:hypothetical protein
MFFIVSTLESYFRLYMMRLGDAQFLLCAVNLVCLI